MGRKEKEGIVDQWTDFPWPQYVGLLRQFRDEKINSADTTEDDKKRYEREYDLALDRLISEGKTGA